VPGMARPDGPVEIRKRRRDRETAVKQAGARGQGGAATGALLSVACSGDLKLPGLPGERKPLIARSRSEPPNLTGRRTKPSQPRSRSEHAAPYPIVIRLAFPPAAAVFTLSERSISNRSSSRLVSPRAKPCTETIAPSRAAICSHRVRS
jgi:hypothetical protein